MDGQVSLGHPAGVPATMQWGSVRFYLVKKGNPWEVDPVCPAGSQGHPAGVPGIFLKFMCPFEKSLS